MHPPRPKGTSEPQGRADRLVDWLLSHCPFCTLAVLSLIVVGPMLGPIADPVFVAVPIVLADAAFLVMRRIAGVHSDAHTTSLGAK
jgi:hypothetical protein